MRSDTQAQISISLPRDLLEKLDAAAAADNRNRSNFIVTVLTREVERSAKSAKTDNPDKPAKADKAPKKASGKKKKKSA